MVLKRRTLNETLGNHEEEAVVAVTTPGQTAVQSIQPAVTTQSVAQQNSWQYHLAAAITQMPEEMAAKLLNCLPKEAVIEMLKSRSNDPLMKLALLLLQRNV